MHLAWYEGWTGKGPYLAHKNVALEEGSMATRVCLPLTCALRKTQGQKQGDAAMKPQKNLKSNRGRTGTEAIV